MLNVIEKFFQGSTVISYLLHFFFFVVFACLSLSVGSFLNIAIVRISDLIQVHNGVSRGSRNNQTSTLFNYPLVEILTLFLSLITVLHFGMQAKTFPALIFIWSLIVIAFIDVKNFIIPNCITFPLITLGLACNVFSLFQSFENALLGSIFGYAALWSILHIYKFLTKKEGLGFGDLKLLAMLGAWLGWQMLPLIIFFASVTGALFGIILIILRRATRNTPLPFGPFLAAGGIIALFLLPR